MKGQEGLTICHEFTVSCNFKEALHRQFGQFFTTVTEFDFK